MKTLVTQRRHNGCAVACLEMILINNGLNLSPRKIAFLVGDNPILSLSDINRILKRYGIRASSYRANRLKLIDIAAYKNILIHSKNHYYIIDRIERDQYRIFDPARLRVVVKNAAYIERNWDGYFLTYQIDKYYLPLYAPLPFVPFPLKLIAFNAVAFSALFYWLAASQIC